MDPDAKPRGAGLRASRLSAAALALLLSLVLVAGCGGDDGGSAAPAADFQVDLPSGWEEGSDADLRALTDGARTQTAQALGVSEDELTIEGEAAWFDTDVQDGFATNINVLSEEIPDGLSDEDYIDATLGSVSAIGATDTARQSGPDVDGDASEQLDYTAAPDGNLSLRFRAVAFVHDGRGFTLTFTAPQDRFDSQLSDLDSIISSWSWE